MFGYVIIDKPNILIKDYNTYRAYYCGLCKSIGKQNSQLMRLTLNYDIVLLALLGYNYENKEPVFKKATCPNHWIKKVEYVDNNDINERICDINAILGYYKLHDDVVDEGKHRGLKALLTPVYKKAAERSPKYDQAVKVGYENLRKHEKQNADIETLAECFGTMLMQTGEALTSKCDGKLKELLFYVGKWIYVIDAIDDAKKDFEKQNFNPLLREIKCLDDKFYDEVEKKVRPILYDCIERVITAYNSMEINISEGALSNIIYLGLKQRTEGILSKRGKKCQEPRL